jgi:hypothetical protein
MTKFPQGLCVNIRRGLYYAIVLLRIANISIKKKIIAIQWALDIPLSL